MEEILTDMIEKLQDENAQLTAECERLRLAAIDDWETIARLRRERDAMIDACVFLDPVSGLWHAASSRVRAINPSGSLAGGWIDRELAVVAFLRKAGLDPEPTPTVPDGGPA